MGAFADILLRKHNAIATTLFSASMLGSFYYTMKYRRSAFMDATTLITGKQEESDELPEKANYTYQMRFR